MKDILSEIRTAEEKRATTLTASPGFVSWVNATREKYMVREFITYFYAYPGRFSRGSHRVKKLGNYVLPSSRTGELFREEYRDRVHNERTWFWLYLTMGYEALHHKPAYDPAQNPFPPEPPYQRIWEDLGGILTKYDLHGESGGGIHETLADVDTLSLARIEKQSENRQGKDKGAIELLGLFAKPRWMTLFLKFERLLEPSIHQIEMIPPWFHILNYLFFNTPLKTLPIFFAAYDAGGSLSRLSFSSVNLTDAAKAWLTAMASQLPIVLKLPTGVTPERKTRRNMRWWLWHFIGHPAYGRTLSYHDIASLEGSGSRSTIQSGIQSLQNTLNHNLDGRLFGNLLQTARGLGLDTTAVYDYLDKDDFDSLNETP